MKPRIPSGEISVRYLGTKRLVEPTAKPVTKRAMKKTKDDLADADRQLPTKNSGVVSKIAILGPLMSANDPEYKLPNKAPTKIELTKQADKNREVTPKLLTIASSVGFKTAI